MKLHEPCSGSRERPCGDAAGAAARGGAAGVAKGTRRGEARRQERRAAARGRRSAVWRHALPLWARSGVTPFPFGACPSGFASAPASTAYKGKPNDWTGRGQRMEPRRIWLADTTWNGFGPPGVLEEDRRGGCRHVDATWCMSTRGGHAPSSGATARGSTRGGRASKLARERGGARGESVRGHGGARTKSCVRRRGLARWGLVRAAPG